MRVLVPQPRLLQVKAAQPAAVSGFKPATSVGALMGPDDPTDPYVVAQATALSNDPNKIYAFVRDRIKFEAYRGSLRGARGTLWAMAGNTLDKSSLLAAMLQASGFTTQYMHTVMNSSQAGNTALINLIHTMFPPTPVLLGCIPVNTPTDDPGFNGFADSWANDYYWVEYGPSHIDLDPSLPNGQPGQTLQASDSSFTTVPTNLMQQVIVKINAEQYSQASGLFGFGPTTTTVLTQSFYTWALVGNIISAGNIVQSTYTGGLDISASTFTYTPYLLIGSGGPDVTHDSIVTGTDYQEFYTNFPLGSQILTGLFVEVDAVDDYNLQPHAYTHTMFDRIGPAARQGNASTQLSLPANPTPAVTDFDIASLNILPTRQALSTFQAQQTRLNNAYQNYQNIQTAFQALPTTGTLSAAQQQIAQQAANLAKYLLITGNELVTMAYDGAADQLAGQLDLGYDAQIYPTAPRITVAGSSLDSNGNPVYSLDVLKNDMFVIGGIGQNRSAPYYEEVARGMFESTMEANILSQVTGATTAVDIGTVMGTLGDPNQLITIVPPIYNSFPADTLLSSTTLSADAQTLILEAVENGYTVLTPNQMVTVNGVPTVGWWETDANGHTVSHFPNGLHQAIADYAAVNAFAQKFNGPTAKFIGFVAGFGITGFAFASAVLEGVADQSSFTTILKNTKTGAGAAGTAGAGANSNLQKFFKNLNKILKKVNLPQADPLGTSLLSNFATGLKTGIAEAQKWVAANLPNDPEVPVLLTTPLGPGPTGVTPGATPGVTVNITTDPIYTIPFNGNELPVYDVKVVNTGPTTDKFLLVAQDSTFNYRLGLDFPGFVNQWGLTLAPGQAGEANMCVLPQDLSGATIPAVGTSTPFQVTATGQTGGATAMATTNFVAPSIPSLSITVDPSTITVAPGGSVSANLIIGSLGNASPGPVTLSAAADPGVGISGLASPVTVPINGAISQPVTFTAAANAGNNVYNVVVTASYNTGAGAQSVSFGVPVTVQALGTCTLKAALSAQTNMTGFSNALAGLANDMNAAAAAPGNPAFVTRIAGDLIAVNYSLANVQYLTSFAAGVTAAGNAVASATPATLLNALTGLDAAICPVATALSQASNYNVQISMSPNSLVTGPNLAAVFKVALYNPSNTMQAYNLSVTGVPSGVTSQFNVTSVTLGPLGGPTNFTNSITLTLTPGASFTAPFTFNVVATPVGAPEFAISAPGTLLVRPQQISIDEVTATPAYGPPGTKFVITARVFAEVNQDLQMALLMQPYTASGSPITFGYGSSYFNLTTTSTLQTITIGTIDSTNFSNGTYTMNVTATNGSATIPGATAMGSFLVGAPLAGTLTANASSTPPGTVPPGSSSVQVALNITRDATPNPVSTLVGTVGVSGVPRTMTLYQNGAQQLAYVCSDSVVSIVDVTNPANPTVLGTFAGNILTTEGGNPVTGFQGVTCQIYNHNLIMSYSRFDGNTSSNPIPTHFATFSLANPLSPVEVGSVVDIQRSDSAGSYIAGNVALLYQSTTFYNQYSNFIFQETGDIWAADLTTAGTNGNVTYLNDVFSCGGLNSNNQCNNVTNVPNATFANGVCTPNGTTPVPNDPTRGGPYRIGLGSVVNSTTSYFTSTSANGGNIENPTCPTITGQLLVIDTSTPTAPAIVTSVSDPAMASMTGIAIQGNLAVAVGDSTGVYDINSGYVGTLVVSSFDITNPRNPVLLNSITTQLSDKAGSFVVPLGMNTFAVGNTTLSGNAELVLIDASNPNALRYIPYTATFVANPTVAQNGYFFALSATPASTTNSLSAFQLSEITGPQLTVKLQLPKGGNASVAANSFSLAPSSVTTGTTFDTYEWDQPTPNTISFNMNVTGLNPGDVPTVVVGGEMDYTLPSLGSGKYVLPPLTVLCQQIMSISPEFQNDSNAGLPATYVVTVSNPTTTSQTFVLSTLGIPASWSVQEPASVTVAPGASQTYNLVLTPPLNAAAGVTDNFFAVVNTAGGITASVGGALAVNNIPNSNNSPGTQFVTFTASLSPSQITIGQNGTGTFQLSITNTGNTPDYIQANFGSPTFTNNPTQYSGWQVNYNPTYVPYVLPGLTNTVTLTGNVILPPYFYNTSPPGSYPIVIQVQHFNTIVNLNLTVNVVANGVTASISPGNGTPQTAYSLILNNVSTVQDNYNLSVIGPLAQVVSVPATSGVIGSLKSATIPIAFNTSNFVTPGNYTLQLKAVSQGNPSAQTYASATIAISGSKGVAAAITPATASIQTSPGSVPLLFLVNNTGNIPDTYTATILGTTGPVTATLNGSGQTIASFPIPALDNSQFPLTANVTGSGAASVTVGVTSLSDNTIKGQATVMINNATPPPPTAVASPTQANTPVHRLADLDASGSTDPSNLPLTYAWTLTSAPSGSAASTGSIALANSAIAAFRPDVLGNYTFNVRVSNGTSSANATASYNAIDAPPVAVTGNGFNAAVHGIAVLHGKNSYDPDGQPITYSWTLVSAPSASTVTSASISNSQTPEAFFAPDVAGSYKFQLIVSDATASSVPATVTVVAYTDAVPPNANAGPNQNTGLHATVTLNGSGSVDPNFAPLPLNYQWTLTTVPAGSTATLSGATNVDAQFTPDLPGTYVASLMVNNSHGFSQPVPVTITAFSGDVPPNANAGANQFVLPGTTATLSSAASADPDSGPLNLASLWWLNSLPFGSTATPQQPNTAAPTFVADKSGYYVGRVEAADGLLSSFANTLVTSAATCDADANGVINQTDIAIVTAAIGQSALTNDPRDFNHDGQVTSADVTGCTALVSNAPPTLVVASSFNATLAQGSSAVAQTLSVVSTGNPLGFTVTSNQPWLTSSVTSGSTANISTLNAVVNPSGLSPATYTGTLTFTPTTGAAQTITVTLIVTPVNSNLCDINVDGAVNVADVQLMINEALGVRSPTNDLNSDGVVNVADLQIDINAALGLGCTAH